MFPTVVDGDLVTVLPLLLGQDAELEVRHAVRRDAASRRDDLLVVAPVVETAPDERACVRRVREEQAELRDLVV